MWETETFKYNTKCNETSWHGETDDRMTWETELFHASKLSKIYVTSDNTTLIIRQSINIPPTIKQYSANTWH